MCLPNQAARHSPRDPAGNQAGYCEMMPLVALERANMSIRARIATSTHALPTMKTAIAFIIAAAAIGAEANAQEIAFTNATVITMESEAVLEGHTVLVRGDRIAAVGPASEVRIPDSVTRIDATGKYLMPGLTEMHGHIPRPDQQPGYTEDVLFLYVANGFTTVRGMLGAPGQLELRDRAHGGELVSPNLYLAGPAFSGGSIESPEQASELARAQQKEGWALLKVLPGLTLEEYDAMAQVARELGIRFAGHVPADVGILHAIAQGQDSFDHIDGYVEYLSSVNSEAIDEEALGELIRLTKEAEAWVVPTMAFWEVLHGTIDLDVLLAYDETRYMPPQIVDSWVARTQRYMENPNFDRAAAQRLIDTRMHVLRELHENGVGILLGTDAPQIFSVPGFSLHRELERMVKAGMSPYAILVSGTRNVGKYFANEDRFGTITVGSRADLLLLEEDPLEAVSNVRYLSGVMVRGRWLSRDDIDARLESIAFANARDN